MKKKKKIILFVVVISLFTCLLNRQMFITITSPLRKEINHEIKALDIPEIKLMLNEDLTKHFEELYKNYELEQNHTKSYFKWLKQYKKNNTWQNATLEFKGETFQILIKSHGKTPSNHKEREHISLSIKLKNNLLIRGANRFNLIIYWRVKEFNYPEYLAIAKDFNLLNQKNDLVKVKINNKKHKLYFFEYRINKTYLNEISNLNLISLRKNNNKSLLFFDDNYDSLQNEINNELEGGKYDYLSFEQKELTKKKFDQLNSKILNHKHEEIDSFFDIDYIANVLAMKTISGSDDGFEKCNLIAPLSLTNNKFYPIIHRDCEFREIKNSDKIDSIGKYYKLLKLINRNDIIRIRKYEILYRYISTINLDSLKKSLDSIRKFHESLYYSSKIKYLVGLSTSPPVLKNLKKIETYLSTSNPEIIFKNTKSGFQLKLNPNSFSPISFTNFNFIDIKDFKEINLRIYEENNYSKELTELLSKSYLFDKKDISELLAKFKFHNRLNSNMKKVNTYYVLEFELKNLNNKFIKINKENILIKLQNKITKQEVFYNNLQQILEN